MATDVANASLEPAAGSFRAAFGSIEGMQEAATLAGWDLEYRQLEGGALASSTELAEVDGLTISLETTNRRMECGGTTPPCLVVTVPCPRTRLWINGAQIDEGEAFLTTGGAAMHVVNLSPADVVSMQVDESRFAELAEVVCPEWLAPRAQHADQVDLGVVPVERLARRLRSLVQSGSRRHHEEEADALLTHVAKLLAASHGVGAFESSELSRRALVRAIDYIEEHLADAITMRDLCRHAGASLSAIEKAFRRELSTTPTRYIRTRRLNAARRLLVDPKGPESVSHVAMDVGFTHLGRFSVSYRAHFGVSPSVDRDAARRQFVRASVGRSLSMRAANGAAGSSW